jgi:cytoskeletal protein RodZ
MAREEKGISLEQLQSMTKIQKKYLIGIEEGNYDVMPGKFYVRAFIKQYAESVGLSPEEIFEEYKHEIPAVYEEDITEQLSRVQSRKSLSPAKSKWLNLLPKIAAAIAVVAILFLIWNFVTKSIQTSDEPAGSQKDRAVNIKESDEVKPPEPSGDQDKKEQSSKGAAREETPKGEEPNDSGSQQLTADGVSGIVTTYKLSGTDRFELEIKAAPAGETWVKVTDSSNRTLFEGMLQNGAGQTFDLAETEEAYIIAGRTSDTEIYVNGEKLEYELPPAQYARQDFRIVFEKES